MCFRLLPETLYLAVNIINRFLSARAMSLAKLQLLALCVCFPLPRLRRSWHHPQLTSSTVPTHRIKAEILQAEKYILEPRCVLLFSDDVRHLIKSLH
jgi:hypothetical protein